MDAIFLLCMRWPLLSPLLTLCSACLPDPVLVSEGDTGDCGRTVTWFLDADKDGHGDPKELVIRCKSPEGYVSDGDDCDDTDAAIWEGETVWPDGDSDGFGVDGREELICGSVGPGQSAQGGDCDDTDAETHPGVSPSCGDGVDNNCDDQSDCPIPHGAYEPADADAWLVGEAEDQLGIALAVAGDVNGDLIPDLLVGMPRGELREPGPGAAVLVFGSPAGELSLENLAHLEGVEAFDEAGRAVAAAGDMDEDGLSDILVGARQLGSTNAGGVYLCFGPITASANVDALGTTLIGEAEDGLFGSALVGDVDLLGEDGIPDIVVGAPGQDAGAGAVWIIAGPLEAGSATASELSAASWTSLAGGQLGSTLLSAGDLDGDGVGELAIGAPGLEREGERRGALWVVSADAPSGDLADLAIGWLSGPPGVETSSSGRFGFSLAAPGDVDGDGLDDLMVGAPTLNSDPALGGAAFVLLSSAIPGAAGEVVGSELAAHATLYGSNDGDEAGYSVVGLDDMDADGTVDLCVGAPGVELGEADLKTGAVYCWYGPVEGTLPLINADFVFQGEGEGARAGAAVAVARDLNGLGVPDLLIGAPGEVTEYSRDGAAAVYLLLGDGL